MEQSPHITASIEVPAAWEQPARRYVFTEPVEVWQADRLDHVRRALERVEQAQRHGLYVVGFITYEAAPAFDSAMTAPPKGELPYAWFAAFDRPAPDSALQPARTLQGGEEDPLDVSTLEFQVTEHAYTAAVNRALGHIRAGDIYQVNYTVRALVSPAARGGTGGCDARVLFQTLFAAAPVPHAAYLVAPASARALRKEPPAATTQAGIISLSPELFLRRRGNILESRPMKGTARREPSWAADEAARVALSRDEKNRAENVMIVDLVRNDLGRVCSIGTVTVPELCRVDRFPTVHQMTSLVRGELRHGLSLFDIFAALFPPGSVTGAPKIRAMQVITDLEPQPRGMYCGTIGLFFPNGDFECSVAIRTLQRPAAEAEHGTPSARPFTLGLGSGIVADSDPVAEWRETRLKGEFIAARPRNFSVYETIRYDPLASRRAEAQSATVFNPRLSGFLELPSHLRRLRNSCHYFCRPFPLRDVVCHLRELRHALGSAPARIRLDLDLSPAPYAASQLPPVSSQIIRENLAWPHDGMTVMLSELQLDPGDVRLYHKTTLRPEKYAELDKARALGCTEVLFTNTRGELCEGALSSVVLLIDGEWLTPALHCGLLPGTWRERQLASGRFREAVLTLHDLHRAETVIMGNAVRGEGLVTAVLTSSATRIYHAS